jgi:ATP-dependent Clp protease ATP-binding subunit ClpB
MLDAKLTTKSQEAIGDAIQQASAAGNPQLEPAHLLNALLAQEGGVANGLLDAVGADRGGRPPPPPGPWVAPCARSS